MQGSSSPDPDPHDPSPFKEPPNQAETAPTKGKLAKKTGKPDLKVEVTSSPADPAKFFWDYQKTKEINKETKWLESGQVHYKEPDVANKVPEVLFPPFLNAQKTPPNSLNPSNGEQASNYSQPQQPPKEDNILQVQEDFQVIETHTVKLARIAATQKLVMAQKKMMLNKNSTTQSTAGSGTAQKENQKGNIDQTGHHSEDPDNPSYKQADPFIGMSSQLKYSPSISPPKESQHPPTNTPNQPNANKNLRAFSPTSNNQPIPAPSQPPPAAKGNSSNNPINVDSTPQTAQTNLPANSADNKAAVFNNNRASLPNNPNNPNNPPYPTNPPNPFTANQQPQPNKITNYFSKLAKNQAQINNPTSFNTNNSNHMPNNSNNFNSSNNSYSKVNNSNNPINNASNMANNHNTMPNVPSVFTINQPRPYIPRATRNMEGDWIAKFASQPEWHQYRLDLAQKLKGNRLTDEALNLLSAMTFQSRAAISQTQIQKYAQQIIILGTQFDRMKNQQSELLCKKQYDRAQSKSDHLQMGFKLQSFLNQIRGLYPRQFSSYSQAEIQALEKNERVMAYYDKIKNHSVQQFLREYERFKHNSTKQVEKITSSTIQLVRKNSKIKELLRILKQQQRSSQLIGEGASLAKIQEKQQTIFRLLGSFSSRLKMTNKIMPKNELYYELQDLKALQKQENNILEDVHVWRELLDQSKKGEPYHEVLNILDQSTKVLASKVDDIENVLENAFVQQFDRSL